ncbi:MAG: hypothetical protein ABIZ05_12335 [Pseudonocardiaceae bacterium]
MITPAPPQSAPTEEVAKPPRRVTEVATLVVVVAAMVIALGLAAWFRGEAGGLAGSAATGNDALIDAGTTAQVSGQVREAVQRVYSYDFSQLDSDERAAAQVITGPFADSFQQQFAKPRRELAAPQHAVVVASVPALAVKTLDGDRAVVVVFLDQQAHQSGQAEPSQAFGRLLVTAQRVNGRWKIADAEPF